MVEFFTNLWESGDFMPHGHCYFWQPSVLWSNVVGDSLIALSYYLIPFSLIYYSRKRKDKDFNRVLILFGAFILLCGTTHLIDIYTVWVPSYRIEGLLKLLTGIISMFTAYYLFKIVPKALQIPDPKDLIRAKQNMVELSYGVAHDLRSPIRHISSFSHLLQKNPQEHFGPKEKEYLQRISSISKEMGIKIDALLNYTQTEQQSLIKENLDLKELTLSIVDTYRINEKHASINWEIDELPVISADKEMMKTVLQNLIDNAVKYSAKEPKPHIKVGSSMNRWEQIIYVEDNGVGFDMKYAEKLFQPFERLHSDPDFQGYGIGLANVARIIDRHNWTIEAKSKAGLGTKISIHIP